MKKTYLLTAALIFFSFLFSIQANAQPTKESKKYKTAVYVKNKQKAKTDIGFFYVELVPTSALLYYFSNTLTITYKDSKDLERQLDEYSEKLRDFAKKDGQNPANYNQKSSLKSDDFTSCEKERKDNIKHLTDAGETVKQATF